MTARTNTPDEKITREDGTTSTRIRIKRCCNGCGKVLGDADDRDVDDHGNLNDVRAECSFCLPLLELERNGCVVRQLTERSIGDLWRWIDNGKPFYIPSDTKTYGPDGTPIYGPDGTPPGLKVDGLSVYNTGAKDPNDRRHVARFGDWIIRHPNGRWSVCKAEIVGAQQ